MEQFIVFTGRNLKIYFRDKSAIFFSLLSMIIVIGLTVFFLGDMNIEAITQILEQFPDRDALADQKNAQLLIQSWTCAGIISINAVTVTLAVYSVMIKDRISGKLNSVYSAPISRAIIAVSYVTTAWIASVFICTLTLVIIEVYGVTTGRNVYSLSTHIELMGLIMVNSFIYAALMYVMAMIAKTEGAWTGLGTIVGTLVGFLGGIYVPIGSLSDAIMKVMKCTPVIYSSAMFRSVMSRDIIGITFDGLPEEIALGYRKVMGIDLELFEHTLSVRQEWMLLFGCGILFLATGICMLRYGKKSDR